MNGVIVNIWQFSKRYFPKSHLKVIKKIMDMASEGVEIIYITGNHDDMLRKFSGTTIGEISIVDKKVLDLDGKKSVVFSWRCVRRVYTKCQMVGKTWWLWL